MVLNGHLLLRENKVQVEEVVVADQHSWEHKQFGAEINLELLVLVLIVRIETLLHLSVVSLCIPQEINVSVDIHLRQVVLEVVLAVLEGSHEGERQDLLFSAFHSRISHLLPDVRVLVVSEHKVVYHVV